jgi:hypothetical protein
MAGDNLIYDYTLQVNVVSDVSSADTSFLRVPLVITEPKAGFADTNEVLTATKSTISTITDNENISKIFDGGVPQILVIATDNLAGIKDIYEDSLNDFYTILVSKDFTDTDIADLDLGNFKGVLFSVSSNEPWAGIQAKKKNVGAYYKDEANFFYLWGKFLSATDWSNLQFQELLNDDGVLDNAEAEILFNDRVSFSLKDSQAVNRLSFFATGGEAIIAPYVMKEIELTLQSSAISWIALNRPQYTIVDCSILAQYLKDKVINNYIERRLISGGDIDINTFKGQNFIAKGTITIPKPTALWRVRADFYITNN